MIIYVNIDKNTGEITVDSDRFADTNIVTVNTNTIENNSDNTKFEIAFDTAGFESRILSELININHGNTN